MQDTHTIEGGRLFAAGSGGGDRRLRPHINQSNQQALKCPRCDSLNTKFCYYNNYNLSQPRHFCKSCRRYWTKGGDLRNVPVGGCCRKTKSSKTKQASSSAASSSEVSGARSERNSSSHSSSESSSLTPTTTAAKINTSTTACSTGEVASATVSSLNAQGNLVNLADSRFFLAQVGGNGSSFDQSQSLIDPIATSEGQGQIFTEMGSFTSLMTSSNDPGMLSFASSMADISGCGLQQTGHGSVLDDQGLNPLVGGGEMKMEPINNCGGFLDQTSQIGFPGLAQNRIRNGGLPGLDWQMDGGGGGGGGVGGGDGGGVGDQPLFDFAGPVDQAYWGGQNQWSDHDQYLNFPPLV